MTPRWLAATGPIPTPDQWVQIVQFIRDGGLIMVGVVIIWAFYTDRIVTGRRLTEQKQATKDALAATYAVSEAVKELTKTVYEVQVTVERIYPPRRRT